MRGTRSDPSPITISTVHPRACGEHFRSRRATSAVLRFIPAHAGNTMAPCRWPACRRFIPAHAGNTCAGVEHAVTVHPRACGEHAAPIDASARVRFIPAHAGNTEAPSSSCLAAPTVHPRACGEHSSEKSPDKSGYFTMSKNAPPCSRICSIVAMRPVRRSELTKLA